MYLPFFPAEFGEIIQRNLPQAKKRFFPQFPWGCRQGRILRRVATVPPKKSQNHRESGLFRPKTRGTAGRTHQKRAMGRFWYRSKGFETSPNPYFCSILASAIRFGLPRSHLFDRFGPPRIPTGYIHIYIHRVLLKIGPIGCI